MTYDEIEPGMFLDGYGLLLEKVDDGGIITIDYDDAYAGAVYWHSSWKLRQAATFTEWIQRGTEQYEKHVRRMINERSEAIEHAKQDIAKMESFL